ncbi:MAG: glycosyltransferase family 2 protein [Burkholderiaceae bacterium]|nr:glycosyltransferase family 2 protein [Burkholderiaceae bacterium]
MLPTVSVALCTHNGAAFLEQQLNSIALQSRLPEECVISDDCSEDETLAIAKRFQANAQFPVRIFQNAQKLGVARNFDLASSKCRSSLIFLSDQDDIWLPDRITQTLQKFVEDPQLTLLHADAELVDEKAQMLGLRLFEALELSEQERSLQDAGQTFKVLLRRNIITGATTAFKRDLLHIASPFPSCCVHDEWLGLMASASGKVARLDQPLIAYRQHGNNQFGARKRSVSEKIIKAFATTRLYYETVLQRAEALQQRLLAFESEISAVNIQLAKEKWMHMSCRANLPAKRLKRILPICAEISTRRYWRYSTGWQSIVRDLCFTP